MLLKMVVSHVTCMQIILIGVKHLLWSFTIHPSPSLFPSLSQYIHASIIDNMWPVISHIF